MKLIAIVAILPLAAVAARLQHLPSLPPGELPNSEIVTNIVLDVDAARLENLLLTLELLSSESNSLSIAVGAAAGDSLTQEEADLEWGCDCAAWFVREIVSGNVATNEASLTGFTRFTGLKIVEGFANPVNPANPVRKTLVINKRQFDPTWNRLRIVKRGLGDIAANAIKEQEFTQFVIRIK